MISIAMTTYNGERFVLEQIQSILLQDYSDFELIICDDCSSDCTFDILKKKSLTDNRVKIYRNSKNIGFKKNFEQALSICTGDYIAFCDQDDIWLSNHLSILVNNIGDCDLISGNALLCDANCVSLNTDLLSCSKFDYLPTTNDEWFFFLLHGNIFQGSATLLRRSLVAKALPIPDRVKFHDYWFALIAASNNGVTYLTDCILKYRQHSNNITQNKKWSFYQKIRDLFDSSITDEKISLQINTLEALFENIKSGTKKKQIMSALDYYSAQRLKKNKLQNIKYFLSNYKLMYLNKNLKLLLYRLIKNMVYY